MSDPNVQILIERQERDRAASPVGLDPARERNVLDAVAAPDAPFAEEVKDAAELAGAEHVQDRLTGLRRVLSRNAMIAVVKWTGAALATGLVGSAGWEVARWAVEHQSTLTPLAASIGDDAYWWAHRVLERLRALLETRTPGP